MNKAWRLGTVVIGALLGAGALPLVAVSDAPPAIHRGQLVPTSPKRSFPKILDGIIQGGDRVGNAIVVGGTFTQIKLADGRIVNQRYIAAFDIATGALLPSFAPSLDGPVLAVEAGENGTSVFIGGNFVNVSGVPRQRIAKLDLATGAPITKWVSDANGVVTTIDRLGDRLFIGGAFTKVKGKLRTQLAQLSSVNGRVSDGFTIGVTGRRDSGTRADGFQYEGMGPVVKTVRITPDGSRLIVVHRGDQVGGQTRWGAAVLDVSQTPATVTAWRSHLWDQRPFFNRPDFVGVVAADLSPDGSMFVITNGIGNYPPIHDSVIAFPVAGGDNVQPLWVTQMFDSNYGVAVSDAAVYVGGHFCWTESQQSTASPLYWPGNTGNDYSCGRTSGSVFQPRTIYRYHLAALDLPTGRALSWDPRSNDSFNGVQFIRAIDRGLIVGHDGTRFNTINVGRMGFFDLGKSFNAPPPP